MKNAAQIGRNSNIRKSNNRCQQEERNEVDSETPNEIGNADDSTAACVLYKNPWACTSAHTYETARTQTRSSVNYGYTDIPAAHSSQQYLSYCICASRAGTGRGRKGAQNVPS